MSDESDYDVVSNSGPRSLESSIADFGHLPGTASAVYEPPLLQGARDLFETASLSAVDIQTYVRKAIDSAGFKGKRTGFLPHPDETVRIYVDGTFDAFNAGHALQLRQAKLSFPSVYLVVGVFSDDLCRLRESPVIFPHVERCEVVRHCRWVDEVIPDAPWAVDDQFILCWRINYIALDEGTSVNPECDKVRLKGYDNMKMLGKVIPTRKTTGLTARKLCPPSPESPPIPSNFPIPPLTPIPLAKLGLPIRIPSPAAGETDQVLDIYGI